MRQFRSSGSAEGVMGNHDSYSDEPHIGELIGLRDRALLGLMGYTFARVSAVVTLRVEDYFLQGRRSWVRLHEKGGKRHEVPCHHSLDVYLEVWIAAAGIGDD